MAYQLDEEKTDFAKYAEQHQAHEKNIDSLIHQKEGFGNERDELDKELDSLVGDLEAYGKKKEERDTASANFDKSDKDLTVAQGEFSQFQQDNPEQAKKYAATVKDSRLKEADNTLNEFSTEQENITDVDRAKAQTYEQTTGRNLEAVAGGFENMGKDNELEKDALANTPVDAKEQAKGAAGNLMEHGIESEDLLAEYGGAEQQQGEQGIGERLAPVNDNTAPKDLLAEYGGDETPEQAKANQAIEYQNATKNLLAEYENEEPIQAANDNEKEQER